MKKYYSILKEKGCDEAQKYKNSLVPSTLYKYIPLLDERFSKYDEENKKKLRSLRENKIWLCNYKELNDPFEYKMLYVDRNKLNNNNWPAEIIENKINRIKEQILTTSFSNMEEKKHCVCLNMPMWAHYANNHQGYCVQYDVEKPDFIMPVSYEKKRNSCSVIITNMLEEVVINDVNPIYTDLFIKSLNCKHEFWAYEKEYRILMTNNDKESSKGKLFSLAQVGLKVKAIYIGLKCDKVYEDELKEIGRELGCEIYKMTFDEYKEEFELGKERILL